MNTRNKNKTHCGHGHPFDAEKDRPWADYATGGAADRIAQRRTEPLNLPLARALIAGTAGDE